MCHYQLPDAQYWDNCNLISVQVQDTDTTLCEDKWQYIVGVYTCVKKRGNYRTYNNEQVQENQEVTKDTNCKTRAPKKAKQALQWIIVEEQRCYQHWKQVLGL